MTRKLSAEFLGTLWLVLGGCGTAVLSGYHVGWLGVSLAFGLTVLTMAYAIGHVSGCHLNPAITIGLATAGRHPKSEVVPYIFAQVLGGVAGAAILYIVANGITNWPAGALGELKEWSAAGTGFATNGFGEHSPTGASLMACPGYRGRDDGVLPCRDSWGHVQARQRGVRGHRHWPLPHADSPHQHSDYKHLGQPRSQHRARNLRRRRRTHAALALLGSPDCGGVLGALLHGLLEPSQDAAD